MVAVKLYPPASSKIAVGGQPQIAIFGGVLGGFITNPSRATDQGITSVETLFVDLVNDAAPHETATTFPIYPGGSFNIPPGTTTNVSVNAATTGHKFSGVVFQPPTVFPPTPTGDTFPPDGLTTLTKVIKSYPYQEYSDDDDLQAFVQAYNEMAQQYIDWFNQIGLPVYTGPLIVDALLDWVAEGLYGFIRPVLPSGRNKDLGPFNTYVLNGLAFNTRKRIGPQNYAATTNDTFKRILTWHLFKGDGKQFNIRWLKRRVMRFLEGVNGINFNVDQTYQISVTFGVDNQVNIRLVSGFRTITGGALFNRNRLNTMPFNRIISVFTPLGTFAEAPILKAAIDAGVLELPFQFNYVVTIA